MELVKKAAYLQGMIDGLGIDKASKEGKVIAAMSELLTEMAQAVHDMDEDLTRAYDQINDLSEELEDLEADLYEDDEAEDTEADDDADEQEDPDEDDGENEPFYEVACPGCGNTVYVSEADLDAGEAFCPSCNVAFEVSLVDDEADDAGEENISYEVTCPNCGMISEIDEETLLEGEPCCPHCGLPLNFDVVEK